MKAEFNIRWLSWKDCQTSNRQISNWQILQLKREKCNDKGEPGVPLLKRTVKDSVQVKQKIIKTSLPKPQIYFFTSKARN